jgi:hypothetical protein
MESTTKPVKEFITNIVNKNYKEANAALQSAIEIKLKQRIKDSLTPKN